RYKTVAGFYLKSTRYSYLNELLNNFYSDLEDVFSQIRPLIMSFDEQFGVIERKINDKKVSEEEIREIENSFTTKITDIESKLSDLEELTRNRLLVEHRKNLQLMINDLGRININRIISKRLKRRKSDKSALKKIFNFSELWHNDFLLFFNKIYLDVLMQSYKNRIKDKINEFEIGFNQEIEIGLLKKLAEVKSILSQVGMDLSETQGLKLSISSVEEYFSFVSGFETITAALRKLEIELPEILTLAEFPDTMNILGSRDNDRVIAFPIRKITGYVLETKFIGAVNDLLDKTMESLKSSIYILNDYLSLTRFNLENLTPETEDRIKIIDRIKDETIAKLTKEEEKIDELKRGLIPAMSKKLEETIETLSSYKITEIVEEYSMLDIDNQGKLVKSKFKLSYQFITKLIQRQSAALLYSRTEGILLARQLLSIDSLTSKNEKILDLIESVAPRPEVLKALPHYYKNLFSGKSSIVDDFWISRPIEEAQFDKAIKRFRAGIKGGIMLLGERNAGKTTLCRYITRKCFKEDKIHHIFPMPGGSVSLYDFMAQLQKFTKISAGVNEIFDALPYGSVVVIHDLELWWERSEEGLEVIEMIMDLIGKFEHKCLFIFNMNPFTYELINGMLKIENHFISIIHCRPLNSKELKEMIMCRHRSSGLKFKLEKRNEESISEIALAKLFNKYFDQSNGNPGAVLYQWLCNIEKASLVSILTKAPKNTDLQSIENMDDDQLVVLQQLALHKRMSYGKLQRVLGIESHDTDEIINSMLQTAILEERSDRVFLINPYIEPIVRKVLKRKGLV
ncbi:MAG: hypothetical protein Q8M23_06325, partial [Bacteroidales bacterium]|nr:hypothetical protein [Bacteroidales bacterium]